MLDYVDTTSDMSPPALEYFDPRPGEMVGSMTMLLIRTSVPKAPPPVLAATSSTSQTLKLDTTGSPEHLALQRLRQFKTFERNWDAEQGEAPDHKTIDAATTLLSLLSAKGDTPKVSLTSEGYPMLLFGNGSARGEIIVTSASTFDYFFDNGEGDCDVAFDGRHVPEAVLKLI